uniref:Uncharacterized protein n=1 Tax=Oryza glumipatula TaxID=40148 RepID=A0A0D9Z9Q1_9ORYZ
MLRTPRPPSVATKGKQQGVSPSPAPSRKGPPVQALQDPNPQIGRELTAGLMRCAHKESGSGGRGLRCIYDLAREAGVQLSGGGAKVTVIECGMMNIPFILSFFLFHILLLVHNKKGVSICAAMTSLLGFCA